MHSTKQKEINNMKENLYSNIYSSRNSDQLTKQHKVESHALPKSFSGGQSNLGGPKHFFPLINK